MDVDDFVLSPNQILIQQGSPFRLEEAVRVISGVVYRHWRCCNLSSKWLTDVEFAEVLDEGTDFCTSSSINCSIRGREQN